MGQGVNNVALWTGKPASRSTIGLLGVGGSRYGALWIPHTSTVIPARGHGASHAAVPGAG